MLNSPTTYGYDTKNIAKLQKLQEKSPVSGKKK